MTNAAASPGQKFSLKAFLQGMVVVAALYAALAGWLWRSGPATITKLQTTLASQVATIEFPPVPTTATAPHLYGPPVPAQAVKNISVTPAANPPVTISVSKTPVITAVTPITVTPVPVTPVTTAAIISLPPTQKNNQKKTTPKGRLPVIRKSDGLTPFKAYRRPFDRAAAKG